MARVELKQVSFRYPGAAEDTLRDLSLTVADGEAHALLGASGAGKTTLLNLLSGLLRPCRGQILFAQQDVSALRGGQRRVAQVFQFPVLYESMTVQDNLLFPLRNSGVDKAAGWQRIRYLAEELEISHLLKKSAARLSLFEKQLVAVGKALARPDVVLVLLDEPLTAVEPRAKWRLRQVLRKVQMDTGVTMIYVTHDQTEALTFADRVSVLTAAGILQTGTPQQIYETPAHEFVGHFVGSPGMNFVPARIFGLDAQARLGFRPEWATLQAPRVDNNAATGKGVLTGTVTRVRPSGTQNGLAHGLTCVQTEFGEINVRGAATAAVGVAVTLVVHRYVLFVEQLQVGGGELP